MSEDLIDSDIRVAKTLPSKFYTDEKRFRKLLKAFKTSWQFVGSSNNLIPNFTNTSSWRHSERTYGSRTGW